MKKLKRLNKVSKRTASIDEVLKNCQNFIKVLKEGEKGCFLIRAVKDSEFQIKRYKSLLSKRVPRDMPKDYHKALNMHFTKIFGWPVRNGVFSYGVKSNITTLTSKYGKVYLLFPCGKFKFVYDQDIHDLYGSLSEFDNDSDKRLKLFIDSINYTDKNLNKGMSKIIYNKESAEIIIKCRSYYLINIKYTKDLTSLIWG
jgi:hypothetical protein